MFPLKRSHPARLTNSVREVREAENISVQQLAQYCEVTTETIEEIEAGSYVPSVVLAEHIARRLNRSVEELFTAADPVQPNSATDEERIGAVTHRRVANAFLYCILLALAVACVLEFTSVDETIFYAFFAIWGIGSIIFFAIAGTVRGTTRVNIAAARRKPRMKAIRETVLQAAFWIIAMTAFQHYQEPDRKLTSILLQWGLGGIIYGVMMYLYTYGWRRRKV